jgi:phosphatidylinositol alpha-1,6-mannosyltransferase
MIQDKKILILTSEFPPLPGGIGNHAYSLSNYLHKYGYDVSILTDFRSGKDDLVFDKEQDFTTYRVNRNKLTQFNRIKKAFSLAKKMETLICSGKFSLWVGGLLKSFFFKKQFIAVLHGSEIRAGGKISKALTQWSLKRFDKIIAVSNFTKAVALKYNPSLKIDVINNGFVIPNSTLLKSSIEVKGNPKIVTVGNVTHRKGQHNVINALPLLKKHFPTIHYHCIGIPTEEKTFKDLAKSLNLVENVTFHGALPLEDLVSVLNDTDVFFMLSNVLENGDFEGFGIAILEANTLGLPSIGSNNSGIIDAIKTGFSGELVDPKNKEEIAESFIKIMNNYQNYSSNAISWSSNFTWDKVGKKYIELIEK